MLIIGFDVLNTVLQSFIITYCCNGILNKKYKLSKIKFIIATLIMTLTIEGITYSGLNSALSNILMLILCFIILSVAIKKIDVALVGFGLGYFIITMTTYIIGNLYNGILLKLNIPISSNLRTVLLLYMPIMLMYIPIYIFRRYLLNFSIKLINTKNSIIIGIILDISLILFNTIYISWFYSKLNLVLRAVLYGAIFFCFIISAVYFSKIYSKAKEIEQLNNALNQKIIELRKIKHDYGSEISSLYALLKMGNMTRLDQMFKDIINRNNQVSSTIETNVSCSELITDIIKPAIQNKINVLVDDKGDYEGLNLEYLELIKILKNIMNNSVDALENVNNPIIKYKSYNTHQGIAILIENNGPKIDEKNLEAIFEAGFSTKGKANGERGYGLAIVKEIIEKNSGSIAVQSNDHATKFIIEIPNAN